MKIIEKPLTNGQYLTQEYEKRSLFIHHTCSTNAMSAWRWWNSTPERVGTPFIIDRDGTIYQCFDPRSWAFHLGIKGDDNYHEMHSINIELVAAGQLHKIGNDFRFYPLWPNQTHYTRIPNSEVITLKQPYRGYKDFHDYTDAQMNSLKWLIPYLVEKFPSLKLDNNIDKIFDFDESIIKEHKSGMYTHGSVRKDKTDIIPTEKIISTLKEIQGLLYKKPTIKDSGDSDDLKVIKKSYK